MKELVRRQHDALQVVAARVYALHASLLALHAQLPQCPPHLAPQVGDAPPLPTGRGRGVQSRLSCHLHRTGYDVRYVCSDVWKWVFCKRFNKEIKKGKPSVLLLMVDDLPLYSVIPCLPVRWFANYRDGVWRVCMERYCSLAQGWYSTLAAWIRLSSLCEVYNYISCKVTPPFEFMSDIRLHFMAYSSNSCKI